MTPFLQLVAQDLLKRFDNDLSNVVVIFPNKRAQLFLNDHLYEAVNRPLWLPRYLSIDELFQSFSPYSPLDTIRAVCRLYEVYVKHTGSTETLDFFYGWGERIMSDLNDIDSHLADAHRLFVNASDISKIESSEYLTPEQEEEIKQFFGSWSLKHNSEIKQKFLLLWSAMPAIYDEFRARLFAEGLAYEGALQRSVIESLQADSSHITDGHTTYVFVGLNALSKAEESLLQAIQQAGKAVFYWDYDHYYTTHDTHSQREAGAFLKKNLAKFPNALPPEHFDNLISHDKEITFAASPTDSAQIRYVSTWLDHHKTTNERDTAIVLCNESMLHPTLHNIPPSVETINVTKGFPLSHTYACTFATKLLDSTSCNSKEELLTSVISEVEREAKAATAQESDDIFVQMNNEAFFRLYTILNIFRTMLDSELSQISTSTLRRLIVQVISTATIPFHGEPAVGIQIMGMLETRNLDFKNILLLGCNEGTLPKAGTNNSFIPYFIRRAFGLLNSEEHAAVSAFYFYRLLQRADHITIAYNNNTDGLNKGEMSRFMLQLLADTSLPISAIELEKSVSTPVIPASSIVKTDEMLEKIMRLSPSALNTYLTCPLKFYYRYICKIDTPDIRTEVIEPNIFGNIFHKSVQYIYERMSGKDHTTPITPESIDEILNAEYYIIEVIRKVFAEESVPHNIVVEQVMLRYITQLLERDKQFTPIKITSLENKYYADFTIKANGREYTIKVGGVIDRLDTTPHPDQPGTTLNRVVDYKTGGNPCEYTDCETLVSPGDKRPGYIFQTFVYSLVLHKSGYQNIAPALFYVHKSAGQSYTPHIPIKSSKAPKEYIYDFAPYSTEFETSLLSLLAEIFDKSKPFECSSTNKNCPWCDHMKQFGK